MQTCVGVAVQGEPMGTSLDELRGASAFSAAKSFFLAVKILTAEFAQKFTEKIHTEFRRR
jgi:hypothetical protein